MDAFIAWLQEVNRARLEVITECYTAMHSEALKMRTYGHSQIAPPPMAHALKASADYKMVNEGRLHQWYTAMTVRAGNAVRDADQKRRTALAALASQVQQRRDNNSQRFMGGYTGPAIMDHKVEGERITAWEAAEKKRIEEAYAAEIAASHASIKAAVEAEQGRWVKEAKKEAARINPVEKEREARAEAIRRKVQASEAARHEEAVRREMERLAVMREAQARYEAWERTQAAAKAAKKAAAAAERARVLKAANERAYIDRLAAEMAGYDAMAAL